MVGLNNVGEFIAYAVVILIVICSFLYIKNRKLSQVTREQEKDIEALKEIADVRKNHVKYSLSDNINRMRKNKSN